MDLNPVIIAIPMYFTLMAAELIYEGYSQRKTYRLNDAVTNINTGVLQQLTGTFLVFFKIGILILVYENLAPVHLERTWASFVAVMILWDLCYYWEHRMAHQVSLFWGGHVVHHQSEDYNLSVALRQTSTGFIWGIPFFLPLALLGFHPEQIVIAGGFNLLYQFWIHTEHIGKMPSWFEAVFNTPSHHRVHHARDPKYIDKNFAGILIIWDRWFKTFAVEEEQPHYGITTPLKSWNPVYANFSHYIALWEVSKQARSAKDVLRILFRKPGWMPDYMGGYQAPLEVASDYQKFESTAPLLLNLYIFLQFMGALALNALFLFKNASFDPSMKIAFALWIIGSTIMFGFLFEKEVVWLKVLEGIRLALIPMGIYILLQSGFVMPGWVLPLAFGFSVISCLLLLWVGRRKSNAQIISPER